MSSEESALDTERALSCSASSARGAGLAQCLAAVAGDGSPAGLGRLEYLDALWAGYARRCVDRAALAALSAKVVDGFGKLVERAQLYLQLLAGLRA